MSPAAPNPPMFSRVGEIVWTGGHLPRLPDGTVPATFAEQVTLVLAKVARTLESAGSGVDRLVKVNAYLSDIDNLPEFNDIYYGFLAGHPLPPRTSVEVTRFRDASMLEIEVVAHSN
ncbi:RidA family protein [Paeniglutamicibacter sp. MACA_103]|uniref:RidA family protein n=1 Tax=Paeniglutamicibacter sp. MACA_103 TaxID=3377337 RepID=UPI003893940D